jgi:hypothetical protein
VHERQVVAEALLRLEVRAHGRQVGEEGAWPQKSQGLAVLAVAQAAPVAREAEPRIQLAWVRGAKRQKQADPPVQEVEPESVLAERQGPGLAQRVSPWCRELRQCVVYPKTPFSENQRRQDQEEPCCCELSRVLGASRRGRSHGGRRDLKTKFDGGPTLKEGGLQPRQEQTFLRQERGGLERSWSP